MHTDLESHRSRPPVLRRAGAALVLVVAGALVIHLAVGMIMAAFWTIVAIAAVVAVIWAVKTIVW